MQTDAVSGRRAEVLIWSLVVAGLYLIRLYSYPLFLTIAEVFGIVVAFGLFAIAWNVRQTLENAYLALIGMAYFFVAELDLLHLLSYPGMNLLPGIDAGLGSQLWLAARLLQSGALAAAPLFMDRRVSQARLLAIYAPITLILGLVALFYRFPAVAVVGMSLTVQRVIGEAVVCLLLVASLVLLARRRSSFDPVVLRRLMASVALLLVAEVILAAALALSIDDPAAGIAGFVGHLLLMVSFWYIYNAVISTGLSKPYSLLLRELKQSEEKYHALMDYASDAIVLVDDSGSLVEVNRKAEELLGYSRRELLDINFARIFPKEHNLRAMDVFGRISKRGAGALRDTFVVTKDHRTIPVDITGGAIYYAGKKVNQAIIRDMTERKHADEQLRFLSTHDTLTGLYNRAFFEAEIKRVERGRLAQVSIVMADVDGLKQVNDQRGHEAGDHMLRQTAQLLREAFRAEDIVARIGGDEFAALLPQADMAAAAICLQRVRARTAAYNAAHASSPLSISLGMATADAGHDIAIALRQADEDMYEDKRTRRASAARSVAP
jgi:diguanylate cyclase (GGDEF)-like protein/PAS domain S-box-containing protein